MLLCTCSDNYRLQLSVVSIHYLEVEFAPLESFNLFKRHHWHENVQRTDHCIHESSSPVQRIDTAHCIRRKCREQSYTTWGCMFVKANLALLEVWLHEARTPYLVHTFMNSDECSGKCLSFDTIFMPVCCFYGLNSCHNVFINSTQLGGTSVIALAPLFSSKIASLLSHETIYSFCKGVDSCKTEEDQIKCLHTFLHSNM